jgi:aldose 1-epimerase
MTSLTLRDGPAEAAVEPDGALVTRLAVGGAEILHPPGGADPGGIYPLLPWSNRISGGGFPFGGRVHALDPNAPGEPFPLHGDAWQRRWTVTAAYDRRALLTLRDGGTGPFRYDAMMAVALRAGPARATLSLLLAVENRGPPLPYGLGFHPTFRRASGTSLLAPADAVWLEDARHLPTERVPVASRPEWDFATPRRLPAGWINNAFEGWTRRARLAPVAVHTVTLAASRRLGTLVVYSPGGDAPFVCVEPVSHPVDAHNLPEAPGLVVLGTGERARAWLRITVES